LGVRFPAITWFLYFFLSRGDKDARSARFASWLRLLVVFHIFPLLVVFHIFPLLVVFHIFPLLVVFHIFPLLVVFHIFPLLVVFHIFPLLSVAGGIPCLSRHWTDDAFVLLKLPTLSHRTQPNSPPAFSPKDSSMSLPTEPATLAAGRPQQHNGPAALVHSNTTGPWPSVGGDKRGRHTETQPPLRRHTGQRSRRPSACGWSASKRLRLVRVQALKGGGQ